MMGRHMLIQRRVLKRLRARRALAGAGIALFAYAVWPWTPMARAARPPRTIVFYGFSILGEAINKGVFPDFQRRWKESHGRERRDRQLVRRIGHDHQPGHPRGARAPGAALARARRRQARRRRSRFRRELAPLPLRGRRQPHPLRDPRPPRQSQGHPRLCRPGPPGDPHRASRSDDLGRRELGDRRGVRRRGSRLPGPGAGRPRHAPRGVEERRGPGRLRPRGPNPVRERLRRRARDL